MASDLVGMLEKKLSDDVNGKVAAANQKLDRAVAWELCKDLCACNQSPCAIANLKKCGKCGNVSTQVCRKKACAKHREELATLASARRVPRHRHR